MGTSRKRGGDKAHAKKVAARNQKIKSEKTAMQNAFNKSMKEQMEELKKKYDEANLNSQTPTI